MLDGLDIFSSLSSQELEELSLFCQKSSLSAGKTLFSAGDIANALYVIVSGEIQIINGKQKRLAILSAGDILGEMAILGGEDERTATAAALTDVELITILGDSMEKISEKNNDIFEKIQKIITKRRQDNIDI